MFVDFEKGAEFACPNCGASSKVHDTGQRHWRHLDFWNWKTYNACKCCRP
ncbi:transposase family protein [Paenibacillus sp. F411]|nr:transposase family protein [Paenibacillus sp. F411]